LTRGSSPAQGNGVREVTNFSLAVIEGSGAGLDRVPVEAALESIFAEEGVSGAAAEVQCVRLVVVPGLAAIELEEEPPRLRYPDVRLPEARPATDTANWCDRVVLWDRTLEMIMLDTAVTNTTTLLVYDDLEAVHEYLVRVFGLTAGPLTRDDRGAVVHGEVRAGSHVIWLHPAADGYRFPRSLGAVTSMTVITVDDTDAHHARSVAAGAAIVSPPVDQPHGVREYGAWDPEGRLWYLHAPLA